MHQLINHPLITHKLSVLRDKATSSSVFRNAMNELTELMVFEITRDIKLKPVKIETPVGICSTSELAEKLVFVPVLRAGMGMLESFLRLVPYASVGHIGLYRDHETLEPHTYYSNLPENIAGRQVVVLDPMLATGGSAVAAIKIIKQKGAKHIKLACIVAAPEGIEHLENEHPDVRIYIASIDDKLNDIGYIVPGLGDAGDRYFGT
ncbi:MAG: uracil phosphoribosyltransferase [Bacteroidales bacterium]|nr:uracil phosphoribosyltransferase [Bacteroidales bacterium]MBN2818402.1 uracil phosphoribosyltransferase [Bacteroidales bacterium]